ncbi:uncharacterized protein Z520_08158 [Fonsecaea multimorphosa CBS 102226]|uniref:Uncharacterized protein n=1 Tax=Fonsecaea multimorphosa CBS 102226 TaxID=1442371 RepID=A0A0D2KGZ7_9EURO|nr:uncharacterized protein Z520_08158 [Fonsecaea multimorphosa CBS 102226]KIX95903.1 hypothetical protein Z520_08158 [Fonsecaea multimorphosa CBS 102226]OAL18623.1 hypothetical protein AYO22_10600 [Fonsecaea multimorphosa]
MAPSSARTPNFSRPLPSPYSTGTPFRGSGRGQVDVMKELPQPETMTNTPGKESQSQATKELTPSKKTPFGTAATTTRSPHSLLDKQLAESPGKKGKRANDNATTSPGRVRQYGHGRKLSKFSFQTEADSNLATLLYVNLLSPSTSSTQVAMDSPASSVDVGGFNKPIVNFRPQLWRHLDKDRPILNLDLFWPIKLDEIDDDDDEDEENSDGDDKGVFPFKDLKPLQTFHNLHYLQLNGMMRSYQPIIWATCWVNKNLTKLHLEMALEPEMNEDCKLKYLKIDEKWSYNPTSSDRQVEVDAEYLGSHGKGILHQEFGDGEYLDQQAMKQAQIDIVETLPVENMRYLPISHLTLMNFAIDAGPFFRWFDPHKLVELTFLGQCIDTGFYLPDDMRSVVKVNSPKPKPRPQPMIARVVKPGEVKLVTLKGGKVVPEEPSTSNNNAAGKGVKTKLSQMMRLGKKDSKDAKESGKETAQLERNMANMGL